MIKTESGPEGAEGFFWIYPHMLKKTDRECTFLARFVSDERCE